MRRCRTFTTTGATAHCDGRERADEWQQALVVGPLRGRLGQRQRGRFRNRVYRVGVGDDDNEHVCRGGESAVGERGVGLAGRVGGLAEDNGAFATGLAAAARRVSPLVGADQYAEIVYDQDRGASSWVGVMTRVQGAANGSGYLAIAYAGEVRLYRTDDTGALNFTLLASASGELGSAPRRLRLESAGDTHRVYFNGALVISHDGDRRGHHGRDNPGSPRRSSGGLRSRFCRSKAVNSTLPQSRSAMSSAEGDAGLVDATMTVSLSKPTTTVVTVRYVTANGSATAPQDYTAGSGTVSFAAGTTSQTITVSVVGDGLDEDDEAFVVNLFDAVNATIAKAEGVVRLRTTMLRRRLRLTTQASPRVFPGPRTRCSR